MARRTVAGLREIRDHRALEAWVSAGLCLMRLACPSAATLRPAVRWALASLSEASTLAPFGFYADIGCLLSGEALGFSGAIDVSSERLTSAIFAYEESVLGRLAADPRFEAASDAIARLPARDRPMAVALLAEQLLRAVGFQGGVSVNPGAGRRLLRRPASELVELGLAELRLLAEDEQTCQRLVAGYEGLVHACRHASALLTDSEIFVLENLTTLRSLSQRLTIEQTVEVAAALERALPRRMRGTLRHSGRTPTEIEDDSVYPTGGFSSLSNSGSMENLVCSELVYMDDGAAVGGAEAIDLFDVRYAEGELLYYTRDESVFVRNHRVVTFSLQANLARARFKDASLQWQRLVIVFGAVLCLVRRLIDWLSKDALSFRIEFVRGGDGLPSLGAERALCELLLHEWIEKGLVEIIEVNALADSVDAALAAAKAAQSDLIIIGAGPVASALPGRRDLMWVWLDVEHPRPSLRSPVTPTLGVAGDQQVEWSDWLEAIKTLLGLVL